MILEQHVAVAGMDLIMKTSEMFPKKGFNGPSFEDVNTAALNAYPGLLQNWFPAGRVQGHEFVIGNVNGDKGRSLSVNTTTGVWSDFGDGNHGGSDPVSLYAARCQIGQGEACKRLAGDLGLNTNYATQPPAPKAQACTEWRPTLPASFPSPHHPHHARLGQPSQIWQYNDREGQLLFLVCRFDRSDGGKDIVPFSYGVLDGKEGWHWKAIPDQRPLYGLDRLQANPKAKVLLVEGEKTADAAQRLLPSLVAVTWPGGGKAAGKTDWSPLKGREVVIWPDADKPGRETAEGWHTPHGEFKRGLVHYLGDAGAVVRVVEPPPNVKDGWDLADAEVEGWDTERVVKWIRENMREASQPSGPIPAASLGTASPAAANAPSQLTAVTEWPDPMDKAAFQGPAGRFVRLVEPHSEADPVGILGQFLGAFSNAAGRSPHFTVEADRHSLNLYQVHVGRTSKARKGTSWGRARQVVVEVDPDWLGCIVHGLSSGEGLIHAVRDPIERRDPIKEKGHVTGYETVISDHGVEDKRLLVVEAEFASVLKVCDREGNTLSPTLRMGWDTGTLGTLTRNSPLKATGAHISIIGHITADELLRHLDNTESANGFANRFLWFCVRRSKALPEGGSLEAHELAPVIAEVSDALAFAKTVGEITRDAGATKIWHAVYEELSEGKPGLLGAMIARGEAQVMRLACIYAVLDRSPVIRTEHLQAALAVWEYCERSVRHIFGAKMGDPAADRIVDALRDHPAGMTRTEISSLFGRNLSSSQIERALAYLKAHGYAVSVEETSGGRPIERWRATEA